MEAWLEFRAFYGSNKLKFGMFNDSLTIHNKRTGTNTVLIYLLTKLKEAGI